MVGVEEERRCFMFNSSSDNPTEEPITIRASVCTMRTQGLVEMVSEKKAVELVEKGGWISPTDNIILDIDEDYYGCEAAVTPLYSTHLKQLVLDVMNAWVAKLACIATSHEERQLDSLYHHLLQRLVTTKQFCNQGYLPPSVCGSAASLMNATSIQEDTLAEFSARGLSSCQSPQMQKFILRRIIVFLWKMEIPQLKALAEVGICFTMSPKSTHFDKIVSVKICDGYNRPNNTMVLFHTPGLEEVAERTRQLAWVLHWGPVKPKLVTLCRSTRDGYTPRALFRRIEDDVLHVLERAFRGIRPDTVTYDPDLLGGPYGWYSRH